MWSKLKIPMIAFISAAIGAGAMMIYNRYGEKTEARLAPNEESKNTWTGDDPALKISFKAIHSINPNNFS